MRILVTGAGGGLGTAFIEVAQRLGHATVSLSHDELDVGDGGAVGRALDELRPHLVVNCAALTGVERCENDVAEAYRTNAFGPWHLSRATTYGAVFVHVSTDYVFDGTKGTPYTERDEPNPLSTYGRSKLVGELMAQKNGAHVYVIRTGQVYGSGKDFISNATRKLAKGEKVFALADRHGTPTYVHHLAESILPIVRSERPGLYHVGGPEVGSWLDVLRRVVDVLGLSGTPLAASSEDLGLKLRPRYCPLDSSKARGAGVVTPSLEVAIRDLSTRVGNDDALRGAAPS